MSEPAPHFIVSHYLFKEHDTFAKAESERLRLRELWPKKRFKVYCVAGDFQNPDLTDPARKHKRKHFNKTPKEVFTDEE